MLATATVEASPCLLHLLDKATRTSREGVRGHPDGQGWLLELLDLTQLQADAHLAAEQGGQKRHARRFVKLPDLGL